MDGYVHMLYTTVVLGICQGVIKDLHYHATRELVIFLSTGDISTLNDAS
jgi:hypothetical protein